MTTEANCKQQARSQFLLALNCSLTNTKLQIYSSLEC